MAIPVELVPGIDPGRLGLINAGWVKLHVNGVDSVDHLETVDFDTKDPWSVYFRRTILGLRDKGAFDGKEVTELGAGDLRNLRIIKDRMASFRAVEIDPNRLLIGEVNLMLDPQFSRVPHELIHADAVEFLEQWYQERGSERLRGWVFICLPQSPQGENSADMYDPNARRLAPYKRWDRYGLTLNVAVLDGTRKIAADDLQILIVNSHRVKEEVRKGVLTSTGWEIADEYVSPQIQQDPDTPVGWIAEAGLDDGKRFFEETTTGLLRPISAIEAEARRIKAVVSGRGRERFNVWHQLSFYRLIPK